MASDSLHVRKVEKLANGDYRVIVACVPTEYPGHENQHPATMTYQSVALPASTKNIERLNNPDFVDESASTWLESHGGRWTPASLREYLEQLLENAKP